MELDSDAQRLPGWFARAACLGEFGPDHDPWFDPDPSEAVAICEGCRVRVQCADYALAQRFTFGVWGGLTAEQRRAAQRDDRRAA